MNHLFFQFQKRNLIGSDHDITINPLCSFGFLKLIQNTQTNTMDELSPQTYAFNIDRGGTFTDFYVQDILKGRIIKETVFKVPSQSAEGEGPVVGIRRYLAQKGIHCQNTSIPNKNIEYVNLGTTIATNALLEKKGCNNAMLLTQGFGDLLKIRHQARPNIFDLKCTKKPLLTHSFIEVDQRIYLKACPNEQLLIQDNSKSSQLFRKEPNLQQLHQIVNELKHNNIKSVGVSFCNSYLSSTHEQQVRQFLLKEGIQNVELGSNYRDLGYLKRSQTTNLDAFLNPIMQQYFTQFKNNFEQPELLTLRIMKSDGGFDVSSNVRASQLLLSGPAGGLIGCTSVIDVFESTSKQTIRNLICLDMGGTSTDVSRIQNKTYSTNYAYEVEGIQLCTPHLQIDTIAAGGGSKLSFFNKMFVVGPQSVGSNPGPVCYGIGDELALTDANLILGRLNPQYFPKIFGKNKNESLSKEASLKAFQKLAEKINSGDVTKSIQQIAEGYVEIANQLMAKSARKLLTMGAPDALVIFGSAGGQHCCDLALKIGVNKIFIHKYSGVLSAYGLSKAVETKQKKHFLGITIDKNNFEFSEIQKLIQPLRSKDSKTFSKVIHQLGIGYKGTSYTIKIPLVENFVQQFQEKHKKQNGFSLQTNILRIQYFVETLIKQPSQFKFQNKQYPLQNSDKFLRKKSQVFISGSWKEIPFYDSEQMTNCQINGPALLLSNTSSILIKQGWTAHITDRVAYILHTATQKAGIDVMQISQTKPDPIKLTLYSTRLMAIAQEMGKVLQKISISTNIRQRLDFSCGIFDWHGKLLANAPHLPVHLGSMESAVLEQIKRGIQIGDVVLSNHPAAGGSHLPDLTVITCASINGLRIYLASRGHHADIGGITPGSMPAFSKSLSEEGIAIQKFNLTKEGVFQEKQLRQLFKESRRIEDNVSDLLAQIAANETGGKLLTKLINEYGAEQFKQYVGFICENAAQSVRSLLHSFSLKNNLKEVDTLINTEYMDDGTPIQLQLTIDRVQRSAVFDFTGTGIEVLGNTNAPKSITKSAILYCLRSLIGQDIPLNSGCLVPLSIIIPENSILSPSKEAAVVGGNVETSQKLVDLIFKPFNFVACSQGTMNNFLFGTDHFCYYETICGGSGAGQGFNGTTIQCHMTNTRITDIESLQKTYPVIVRQFGQRKGSGGRGEFTGGNGAIREFLFLEDVTVSILSERRAFSAYGLQGGENGSVGKNTYLTRQGIRKNLGGKNTLKVRAGESVRVQTPGGGGYGQTK